MKAEYTLINHNPWTVGLDVVTLPARGRTTKVLDLTAIQVELLNKQKVDVITMKNGVKTANAAIFADDYVNPLEAVAPVEVPPEPVVVPATDPVAEAPVTETAPTEVPEEAPADVPAEPAVVEPVAATTDSVSAEGTDPKAARTTELLAMNGNTLKATAKKGPYNLTDIDGLAKSALVEKMIAVEFPDA